jgi:hypothetical protein
MRVVMLGKRRKLMLLHTAPVVDDVIIMTLTPRKGGKNGDEGGELDSV